MYLYIFILAASYTECTVMIFLSIPLVLVHTTIVSPKSVYYGRSDDDSLQNHSLHIHDLHYYSLNGSKYFASNTELKFPSGIRELTTIITIKDVATPFFTS